MTMAEFIVLKPVENEGINAKSVRIFVNKYKEVAMGAVFG